MLADSCVGFRKKCSYYDFLEPHKAFYSNCYFIRLDIVDFYNSIPYYLIEEVISHYFIIGQGLNESQKKRLVNYILKAMTYRKKIVQGAITSPALSNVIFRQLDLRIEKYCRKVDVTYTRYADDLLFSSYK